MTLEEESLARKLARPVAYHSILDESPESRHWLLEVYDRIKDSHLKGVNLYIDKIPLRGLVFMPVYAARTLGEATKQSFVDHRNFVGDFVEGAPWKTTLDLVTNSEEWALMLEDIESARFPIPSYMGWMYVDTTAMFLANIKSRRDNHIWNHKELFREIIDNFSSED